MGCTARSIERFRKVKITLSLHQTNQQLCWELFFNCILAQESVRSLCLVLNSPPNLIRGLLDMIFDFGFKIGMPTNNS